MYEASQKLKSTYKQRPSHDNLLPRPTFQSNQDDLTKRFVPPRSHHHPTALSESLQTTLRLDLPSPRGIREDSSVYLQSLDGPFTPVPVLRQFKQPLGSPHSSNTWATPIQETSSGFVVSIIKSASYQPQGTSNSADGTIEVPSTSQVSDCTSTIRQQDSRGTHQPTGHSSFHSPTQLNTHVVDLVSIPQDQANIHLSSRDFERLSRQTQSTKQSSQQSGLSIY